MQEWRLHRRHKLLANSPAGVHQVIVGIFSFCSPYNTPWPEPSRSDTIPVPLCLNTRAIKLQSVCDLRVPIRIEDGEGTRPLEGVLISPELDPYDEPYREGQTSLVNAGNLEEIQRTCTPSGTDP